MRKEISPEERLLRLIRGPKKKVDPRKEETAKIEHLSLDAHEKVALEKKAKGKALFPSFKLSFNTQILSSLFIIILIGLLSFFIYDIYYTTYHKKEVDILEEKGVTLEAEEEVEHEVKPYSFYSSSVQGRNIFLPQQVEMEAVITGPSLEEVSAALSLIGIIAGARPQAIIESKKSEKSYFLYEGQTVDNAKVVEILEDSVVMEYQGETFELVL